MTKSEWFARGRPWRTAFLVIVLPYTSFHAPQSIAGERNGDPAAAIRVEAVGPGSQLRLHAEREATIAEIDCPRGIGRAALRRSGDAWPRHLIVRLHLRGLERLRVRSGKAAMEWSIASTGDHRQRTTWRREDQEAALDRGDDGWSEVRVVGGVRAIPLQNGYFELELPRRLLADDAAVIELDWIDFYR